MDARFEDHGSLWLVHPLSDAAWKWIDNNVIEDMQWYGGALVVEPRYVLDLAQGMHADGLEVS